MLVLPDNSPDGLAPISPAQLAARNSALQDAQTALL
jgi:hypothetical protein